MNAIVNALIVGLDLKSKGQHISNAVQLVGRTWLLSDWEALEVEHNYQVTYGRLDEAFWYDHLSSKPWTDCDEIAEMLHHGKFLRDLASTGTTSS